MQTHFTKCKPTSRSANSLHRVQTHFTKCKLNSRGANSLHREQAHFTGCKLTSQGASSLHRGQTHFIGSKSSPKKAQLFGGAFLVKPYHCFISFLITNTIPYSTPRQHHHHDTYIPPPQTPQPLRIHRVFSPIPPHVLSKRRSG